MVLQTTTMHDNDYTPPPPPFPYVGSVCSRSGNCAPSRKGCVNGRNDEGKQQMSKVESRTSGYGDGAIFTALNWAPALGGVVVGDISTALNWAPALKSGNFHRTKLDPRTKGRRFSPH